MSAVGQIGTDGIIAGHLAMMRIVAASGSTDFLTRAQTEIASGVVSTQMLRQMRVQSDAAQIPNQQLQPCVRRDPFPVNSIAIPRLTRP